MFTLVLERTTQEHLEYLPVAQKFLTGKQGLHPEGIASERTVFTVVVLLQKKKKKLRNHVMSLVTTARLIRQSIKLSLTEKLIVCPLKLRRYAFVNDLRAENAVYHIQCNSNFWTGKGNPKKSVMLRKRGRHTKKEYFSKSLNI